MKGRWYPQGESSVHFIFSVIILSQLIFFYGIYFKWMIWNVEWSGCCYARGEKRHWHGRRKIIYDGISLGFPWKQRMFKKSKTKNIYFISFFTCFWHGRMFGTIVGEGDEKKQDSSCCFSPLPTSFFLRIYTVFLLFSFTVTGRRSGLQLQLPLINQKGF